MFNDYRLKEAEKIQAVKMDTAFRQPNAAGESTQFAEGDYLVKNSDGSLYGVSAGDFDAKYEAVKKTWSRKKKEEAAVAAA